MTRIVIDAMGGDRAPAEVLKGVVQAHERFPELELTLIGRQEEVRKGLAEFGSRAEGLQVVHAPEVVGMEDPPAEALRAKKECSITRGAAMAAQGQADAFVSAGNTGAVVAAATVLMKLLEGVRRPGIAVNIPTTKGMAVVIDVGANVYPKPIHLCQYAGMAAEYARLMWNVSNPRVGLLNVGSEDAKGNELVREVHEKLEKSPLNFVGNAEGGDIWEGSFDVVVCDGFVGNVLLKVTEGLGSSLLRQVQHELEGSASEYAPYWQGALNKIRNRYDYAEYGGAPLLGVNGVCIICHGSSEARAFVNAIRVARDSVGRNVNQHIQDVLRAGLC